MSDEFDDDIEKWADRTGMSETSLQAYSETNDAQDTELVFAIMDPRAKGTTNPEGDVILDRKDSTTKTGYKSTFGSRRYDLMMETPPRVCKSASKERRNKCEVIKTARHSTPEDMALTLQWQANRNTEKASKLAKETRLEGRAILSIWKGLPEDILSLPEMQQIRKHLKNLHLLTQYEKFRTKKK